MRIKLLNDTKCPKFGRAGDAGYDLFLNTTTTFKAHEVTCVDTGVCVELPEGYAGLLAMRSSVCKTGMIIQQPLIDSNYRGEIHILVMNPTDKDFTYEKNDRVCSLYVFPVFTEELEVVDELSATNRGTAWSGSSGK